MSRLFLRLWAKLVVSLLIAAAIGRIAVAPRVERQVGSNIAQTLAPVLRVVHDAVVEERRRGADVQAALDRMSARYALTITAIPREQVFGLDPAREAALDRGELVARGDFESPQAYARLEGTDRVLAFALPRPEHPFGGGRGLAFAVLLALGISIGAAFIAWPLARRLARLSRAVEAIGGGDLSARAAVGPPDAVGKLEATFNAMAAEIQRLVAARGELLRTVSHELRTPIQRLHLALEMSVNATGSAERERRAARMAADLEELDRLIEELLTYSRLEERLGLEQQPIDVADLLHDTAAEVGEARAGASIVVRGADADALTLHAEPRLLRRAVQNLAQNALRHAEGRVEIGAELVGDAIRIDVDDDGPGVPEAERERVFVPFVRLRNDPEGAKRGHGLGLAIVRRIAEAHGGRVAVSSSPLGGARFQLWLPAGGEPFVGAR